MVRHTTSKIETVLTYASFLALSIALHMIVILGGRPQEGDALAPPAVESAAQATGPTELQADEGDTPEASAAGSITPDALLRDVLRVDDAASATE